MHEMQETICRANNKRLKDRAEEHLNPTRNLTTALKKQFLKTKNHSCSNMKFQLLQIIPQQLDRE